MPATTAKQQLVSHALTLLKKRFPVGPEPDKRPVLEEVLYAICREGTTTARADAAYARLRQGFFDWNEVRVSTVSEVAEVLGELPGAGPKAERVIGFLQEVFEEQYSFDLGDIAKKGLKQAAKQLARYKGGVTDFGVAWATQKALGGHAVPLDAPTLRVLFRLGVVDDPDPEDREAARGSLEHFVPKARGHEFAELFAQEAEEICVPGPPDCPHCPLRADCPTGQEVLAKGPKSKPKPR